MQQPYPTMHFTAHFFVTCVGKPVPQILTIKLNIDMRNPWTKKLMVALDLLALDLLALDLLRIDPLLYPVKCWNSPCQSFILHTKYQP